VIGRPILYKTTKEFLLRFGLSDVNELPSMEEFEKLASEAMAAEVGGIADATGVPEVFSEPAGSEEVSAQIASDVMPNASDTAPDGEFEPDHTDTGEEAHQDVAGEGAEILQWQEKPTGT